MNDTIQIIRTFNPATNQLDFTTVVGGCDPALIEALSNEQVNLSRGHTRLYSLTNLSDHNGTGANWKDGREIHTPARMEAYIARTNADIAAAVERAYANFEAAKAARLFTTAPVVVATVSCAA